MQSTASLNVNAIIAQSRIGGLQMTVFALCSLCLLLDGFDVQSMGYVAPALTQEWNIPSAALGNVFGAAPLGVLIGSLLFSMLADRIGRRPVLIGLTFYFAITALLTARTTSPQELLWVRFFSGIGLGGIMPNAVALSGEYSPHRARVLVMMLVGNFFNLGAALGAFLAAWLIPLYGWRSVFYFGGVIPMAISAAMLVLLPESLPFLALKDRNSSRLRLLLQRLAPQVNIAESAQFEADGDPRRGFPFLKLLASGRAGGTLALWVVNFMNLLNLYFLSNWLPTLVRDSGYSAQTAVLLGAALQLAGTIGSLLLAWIVTRAGLAPTLAVAFGCGAVSIALIGQPGLSLTLLAIVVCIAGMGIVGGQGGVNALAATLYPTDLRASGVGAGLGVGRIGAIIGPTVAGQLLSLHWTSQQLFLAAAVPAVISAVTVAGMAKLTKR